MVIVMYVMLYWNGDGVGLNHQEINDNNSNVRYVLLEKRCVRLDCQSTCYGDSNVHYVVLG